MEDYNCWSFIFSSIKIVLEFRIKASFSFISTNLIIGKQTEYAFLHLAHQSFGLEMRIKMQIGSNIQSFVAWPHAPGFMFRQIYGVVQKRNCLHLVLHSFLVCPYSAEPHSRLDNQFFFFVLLDLTFLQHIFCLNWFHCHL